MGNANRSRSMTSVWTRQGLLLLLGLALLLAAAACGPTTPTVADPADSKVATQVAATLTGLAPSAAEPSPTPEAPEEATTEPTASPTRPAASELLVVYVDDGNPWLTTESGPPRQLSQAGDTIEVLISDDGAQVVFVRREAVEGDTPPVEIRAVNADGSSERVLMRPAQFDALYPLEGMLHHDVASIDFIPDSHDLLLNTRAIPEGPGLLKHDDLLRLDSGSGELRTLFPPGDGGDFVTSPDGSQLALIQPDSISLANVDGSNLRSDVVTYQPVITYSEFRYYAQPIWAADSRQLAVMIPSSDPLADAPTGTAWRIALDGSATEVATHTGDFFFTQHSASSVIAPDLARLIVPRRIDSGLQLHLGPLGGELSSYDTGDLNWMSWNPAGSHFVYGKGAPTVIQLGSVDGPSAPLVEGTDLRWTGPDSFLFLSGSRGAWTLRQGALDGSTTDLAAPAGDFIPYDFALPSAP